MHFASQVPHLTLIYFLSFGLQLFLPQVYSLSIRNHTRTHRVALISVCPLITKGPLPFLPSEVHQKGVKNTNALNCQE